MSKVSRDADGRLVYTSAVRVYMEDTDSGGIVYYVNYLKFMERARTDMFRLLGCPKPAVFSDDLMFVVHSLSADYLRSAELDDELQVSATITRLSKVTVFFEQSVSRVDPATNKTELLCTATIKIACVSRAERKPKAIPQELQALLR